MKFSLFSLLGLLATLAIGSAVPDAQPGDDDKKADYGGGGRCDYYKYNNVCRGCNAYPQGGFGGQKNVCYRDCPREWLRCRRHYEKRDDGDDQYSLNLQNDYTCARDFRFQVVVRIEDISGQQYLTVRHNGLQDIGSYKRDADADVSASAVSITTARLGIYRSEGQQYNPNDFNFNNYCRGSYCNVPVRSLPTYPNLCDSELYLAVGNNACYDGYGNNDNNRFREGTKYVKVRVRCGSHEKRDDYGGDYGGDYDQKRCRQRDKCCCPRKY